MATEARPMFLAFTGRFERETLDAAARFAAALRAAAGERTTDPELAACVALAARAFGGERDAWPPLVAAVRRLLARPPARTSDGRLSRRELRAFVAENADLLDA